MVLMVLKTLMVFPLCGICGESLELNKELLGEVGRRYELILSVPHWLHWLQISRGRRCEN